MKAKIVKVGQSASPFQGAVTVRFEVGKYQDVVVLVPGDSLKERLKQHISELEKLDQNIAAAAALELELKKLEGKEIELNGV